MFKKNVYAYSMIGLAIIIALVALPYLPDQVPTHWGVNGEVDGYSSKYFGAFMAPFFMIIIYFSMVFAPRIDPKKKNYPKFNKNFTGFKNVMITFFFGLHMATIIYSLGYEFSMDKFIIIGVGCLFAYIGNIMPQIKPNYFMGLRTPWTLDNEEVWVKSHRIGGKIMFVGGIAILLSAFINGMTSFIVIITVTVVVSVGITVISYFISKEVKNR